MCDDLGLQHKVVARAPDGSLSDGAWTSGADLVVQVQKTDANTLRVMPAPLDELLQRDAQLNDATNSRKYDALPLYWSTAQGFLRRMDKEQLSLLAHRQLNAMRNYPMISWSLLWMQELRERNIPLQHGTLRSALKMCDKRSDIYGLLEILYFAEQEAHLGRTAGKQSEYGALLHRFNEQPRYSAAMQHFRRAAMFTPAAHDSSNSSSSSKIDGVGSTGGSSNVAAVMDGSQLFDALASVRAMDLYGASSSRSSARKTHGTAGKAGAAASQPSEAGADTLSNHDWNKACLLAFRSGKQAALPMHSYREAFTEVRPHQYHTHLKHICNYRPSIVSSSLFV